MVTNTQNLNLTLPNSGDKVDVEVLNRNFEKLDDRLGSVSDSIIVDDLDATSMVHVTNAAARPAVGVVTYIEPLQSGSGVPSPDNVRPISGWEVCHVISTRRNLYPGGDLVITGSKSVYFTVPLPPGTYTISADITSDATGTVSRVTFVGGREDGSNLAVDITRGTQSSAKVIVSNPVERLAFYSGTNNSNSSGVSATWSNVCLVSGGTAEAHEPYAAETLTAELPETIYGGYLDWGTGVLTVKKGIHVFDGVNGIVDKVATNSGLYYASGALSMPGTKTGSNITSLMSDKLITKNKVEVGCCYITGSAANVLVITIPDQSLTTVDAVNAWLEDNPITFVYDLATPYTIQLTPQQLLTVKSGVSNVWSNCGKTELSYVADTKKYIDGLFATLAAAQLGV